MIMGAELLAYGMANESRSLTRSAYLEVVSTEALTPRGQKESEGVMIHTPVEQPLPVVRVGEIQSQENAQRWLVEGLWGASSVGVIGGAPKCAKTWLGLDMALSVATGTACLGKYAVPEPGPVLVYLAEDALPVVRERDRGHGPASRSRSRPSRDPRDHRACAPARSWSGPRAAVGDDQAAATPAAPFGSRWCDFTASTRTTPAKWPSYWRTFARCSGSSTCRFCWCITRGRTPRGELPPARDCAARVTSMPSATRTCICGGVGSTWCSRASTAQRRQRRRSTLELVATDAKTTHLEVVGELRDGSTKLTMDGKQRSLEERVLDLLGQGVTVTRAKLRDSLGVKNERLGEVLESLERAGRLCRTPAGWQRLD